MPYTPPEHWSHGDYPTAAKINKYKDGLDAIYALTGSYASNGAVRANTGSYDGYYLIHRLRWLIYRGAGQIMPAGGVGEVVTLTGDGSTWLSYDLSQVEWLAEGTLYHVEDVEACLEDNEAL
jgi:hypothetical protein